MIALLLGLFPSPLQPPAPFPHVIRSPLTTSTIAPGLTYGDYDLTTQGGPIVVHVLEVAPNHPELRLETVLAHDALTSSGETVSSMAHRSGAVAAINGDYFDIGQTNQPVNIVVVSGTLVRTPRKRYSLVIGTDGAAHIVENSFSGNLEIGGRTVPITGVDQMLPPHGDVSILTPQYGPVEPNASITLLSLKPISGTPPFATYQVVEQADNLSKQPPGFYAAIGENAIAISGVPNPGDSIVASGDLSPIPLDDIAAALGGGPLILRDGAWFDDPDGPRGGSYDMRAPQSGAALLPDGTLVLFQVDGRQPDLSIGVTPREFSALMRAFGATTGMEFDSGGSSQMDVRIPGDANARVVNSPSDGRERPIADALAVIETAPAGPAVAIAAQPQTIRALAGARVAVKLAAIDANQHPASAPEPIRVSVEPSSLGTFADGTFTATRAGNGDLVARSGSIVSRIPLEISRDPATVSIFPRHPAVAQDGVVDLQARAYDARGYEIALPEHLPWRAQNASISADGTLRAGNRDALVSLLLGDHLADTRVAVGFRDVPLPFESGARFETIPRGGAGAVTPDPTCGTCIALRFSLGPHERAAYAVHDVDLPPRTTGLAFDILDDGSGAQLKVVLHNAIDEEVLLHATLLSGHGWRRVVVPFPATFAGPGRLTAIYAIAARPGEIHDGTVLIKNVKAVVAGSE